MDKRPQRLATNTTALRPKNAPCKRWDTPGMVRSRGLWPWPVVKPSFQVFSLSAKATNKVPAVVLSGTWRVAGVVMGFLLHSDRSRVMEKKLTNSDPLRKPADKHSIYPLQDLR